MRKKKPSDQTESTHRKNNIRWAPNLVYMVYKREGSFFFYRFLLDIIQEKCRNRDEKIVCLRMFVNNIFIIFFFCCLVSVYVRVYFILVVMKWRWDDLGIWLKGYFIHYDGRSGQVTYKHVYEGRFFFIFFVFECYNHYYVFKGKFYYGLNFLYAF